MSKDTLVFDIIEDKELVDKVYKYVSSPVDTSMDESFELERLREQQEKEENLGLSDSWDNIE